jgi:excisionase family DNA binding protein
MLRVSLVTLYRMTRDGELTVVKRGKRYVRYRRSDIQEFIDRHTYYRPQQQGEA